MRLGGIDGGQRCTDEFFFAVPEGFASCRIDVQYVAVRGSDVAVLGHGGKKLAETIFQSLIRSFCPRKIGDVACQGEDAWLTVDLNQFRRN